MKGGDVMFIVSEDSARRDYRRFNSATNAGFSNLMMALATSPIVQEKWRSATNLKFIQWASCVGGLGLGLATARYLHQQVRALVG